jgi:hypothetical protein
MSKKFLTSFMRRSSSRKSMAHSFISRGKIARVPSSHLMSSDVEAPGVYGAICLQRVCRVSDEELGAKVRGSFLASE